ncbi:hypothetical protein [Sedimenticola sp.]|uniref:hypothetical protein n=1 Tax=Sedimenticola sp. TaxID=1940285 RepID=UPI003D143EB0
MNRHPTVNRHYLIGSIFIALGLVLMMGAFGIGPLSPADLNGPAWIGVATGMVFAAAGAAVMLGRDAPRLRLALVVTLLAGLAVIGNWIAFGIGERTCNGSIGLLFVLTEQSLSGLACRIPFAVGAIMTNGILLYAVATLIQKIAGGPPRLNRLVKLAEWLMLLSLGPVLIPLIAALLLMAVSGALWKRLTTGFWPRNEAFIQRRRLKRTQGRG